MMEYKYNGELYKEFTKDEAYEWGMKNYSHWLINLQDQENMPKTPVEKFFRYYTQGIHYSINRILRYGDIETTKPLIGYRGEWRISWIFQQRKI